jgi:sirohydrochlorin ferrochelatase
MTAPTLVLAAHGSRDPAGQRVVEELAEAVRRAPAAPTVAVGYLQRAVPALIDVLASLHGPVVLVPLLLATGFHVRVDLPAAAAGRPDVRLARPLGPDPALVDALADRLADSGAPPTADVVLAAAGSTDPGATAEAGTVAGLLARRLGRPVQIGFAAAGSPTVAAVIAARRAAGRPVALARYLLAPGHFATVTAAAGADWVAPVLGAHPAVVDLVLRRFVAAGGYCGWTAPSYTFHHTGSSRT